MDLRHLIFSVLFYLSAGFHLSTLVLNPANVTRRFYLIHGLPAAALSVLAFLFISPDYQSELLRISFWIYAFSSCVFCYFIEKNRLVSAVTLYTSALSAILCIFLDASYSVPVEIANRAGMNALLSAGLLGATMASMILGHWYLNQPKMPVDELKKLTVLFLFFLVCRTLWAGWILTPTLRSMGEAESYRFLLTQTKGIFVLMRTVWGILGPLVLSYFIWGTVKIRSTQSATGILYVGVVFVLIGEIISLYLTFFHQLPI